jgi:hypothetical protein
MKRSLVSTTSALALLVFGGGRVAAAPVAAVSDSLLFGTTEQTDVVRESLSLGDAATPLIAGVVRLPGAAFDKPTIVDPGAQSPSATFTYRPAVMVRGDTGAVGSTASRSRRNPGNVSNLTGTIAASPAGIFAVPATQILVNDTPASVYNYIFRPSLTLGKVAASFDTADIVRRVPHGENPGHSVFVGVRPPVPEEDADAAARKIGTLSATGSATPTVVLAIPRKLSALDAESAANLGYRTDAGLSTTIGFSTQHVRPTPLALGAAATSTLGYTYVPQRRGADSPVGTAEKPRVSVLSATVAAAEPSESWERVSVAASLGLERALSSFGTAGMAVVPAARIADVFPAESFAIARPGRTPELVTIPIVLASNPMVQATEIRTMLLAAETTESDEGYSPLWLAALAGAIVLPAGLAFLGFRMIRRAALRRLTGG